MVLVLAAGLLALGHPTGMLRPSSSSVTPAISEEKIDNPQPVTRTLTIAAVGDLLMHVPIGNSVRDAATGRYAFNQVFAPCVPYISRADLAVANLETRLAGPEYGYHGFPRFNTPQDLAGHLRDSGFDLVATANNHCLDWGWPGVVNTLDCLERAGLFHIGTFRTAAEKEQPFIVVINGVRLAFLNYTDSVNGMGLPVSRSFAYNMLDTDTATAEAMAARDLGADLVIAVLHFGNEYQRVPSERQRDVARRLCEGGVDVIVGSHPHVVQPIEWITVDRNGIPVSCLVAWSLGNFVSCQDERYRDSGIILYLEIEKAVGLTHVSDVEYLPVWVQRRNWEGRRRYRVLPANPEIEPESDVPITESDRAQMARVWADMNELLTNEAGGIRPFSMEDEQVSSQENARF
jgi:poly-gamma-glutamate synthesis protein (capsule biosynthesis protein)